MRQEPSGTPDVDREWVREPDGRGGLRRYLGIARDHWRLIAVLAACVVGVAVAVVNVSAESYEAEALLAVSPVARDDARYDGLSVIRETSVPTRDVETLARLVRTVPVAERASQQEGVGGSAQALLGRVTATPIGGSFLVSVTAEAPSAEGAAALANAFATSTIEVRGAQFRAQVESLLDRVGTQIRQTGPALPEESLGLLRSRLAQLETLREANDPSVLLEAQATPPAAPSSPGLLLVLPVALIVGLLIGFGGAVAVDSAGTRVRTEGQLLERFDLPVLARVPRRRGGDPAGAAESYRDLAQGIAVLRRDPRGPRSVLLTSAADTEDRTECAIETARTLADAGQRVLLVDADIRRPTVARALGLRTAFGTASVMMGRVALEEALVDLPGHEGSVSVLSGVDLDGAAGVLAMSPGVVRQLLDDAAARADFVIFDAAPLGVVADALPIATAVDDVVVVVRRGQTELSGLGRLASVLTRHGIAPRGFVLVGWPRRAGARGDEPRRAPRRGAPSAPAPPEAPAPPARERLPRP